MKVFVTGATGVLGTAAVGALTADGHQVVGLARTSVKARHLDDLGARPAQLSLFDARALREAFEGVDVVCNLATHMPSGLAAMRPGAWRINDRIRTDGARAVVAAATAVGVARLVQESVSTVYADAGDDWVTEDSPIMATRALDPAAVAESTAEQFGDGARAAVVLRFGQLIGDDVGTRWMVERARAGKPIGIGEPQGWMHVLHPDDAGQAVVSALTAPGGVYNVGADPIRRSDLVRAVGAAVGREQLGFLPKVVLRVGGERLEPATRSLRVSSARLHKTTGWKPLHATFGADWLPPVPPAAGAADVFGDVLPGSTRDDWADPATSERLSDEDYRRERPPHY